MKKYDDTIWQLHVTPQLQPKAKSNAKEESIFVCFVPFISISFLSLPFNLFTYFECLTHESRTKKKIKYH